MDYKTRKEKAEAQKKIEQLLFPYEGNYGIVSTSNLGLEPGDIILLTYLKQSDGTVLSNPKLGVERMGIVVSSRRTGEGVTFASTRNNMLLNVFLIDSLSDSLFRAVVNTFYNREKRCDYHLRPQVLNSFLKKENFRTLNLRFVGNLKKVIVNMEKFRTTITQENLRNFSKE